MSLNETPASERIHIGLFGMRNAGKSSLLNALTGQEVAVVSPIKGTTTDPVKKAMELLPLGPVVLIDTPGLDDEGELGQLRVERTEKILKQIHLALVVTEADRELAGWERELIKILTERKIPFLVVANKADLLNEASDDKGTKTDTVKINLLENGNVTSSDTRLQVSAITGYNITLLKEKIAELGKGKVNEKKLVADLIKPGDVVVLVVPIDEAAPKGRLILPQQQTIRELLEVGVSTMVCKDTELEGTLGKLKEQPALVITDSQVFQKVSPLVSKEIPLTSFSILFARYKGSLSLLLNGAAVLDELKPGDKVLISEGCTHHRQCGDIGTVKLPAWIEKHCGAKVDFTFTSGQEFPENLQEYKLVIHCGGCTLTEPMMKERLGTCRKQNIPVTNYGMAIAHMNGILERSTAPFTKHNEI